MHFTPSKDIPVLTDKVILVTGGTDGLGKETVRELSLHSPAHIYLASRNQTKADKVLEELKQNHPNHAPITFLEMDLSSLASVKAAAQTFLAKNHRLDILVCNAGAAGLPSTTKDGYESSFGANHLGHAFLIRLLLPVLQATTKLPDSDVRVVVVSSAGEKLAPKHYAFQNMKSDLSHLGTMTRYAQSKLANVHYASVLAKKYPEITSTSVHPGTVRTNFGTGFFEGSPVMEFVVRTVVQPFLNVTDVSEGAKGQLWCATAKKDTLENGAFYWPVGVLGKGSARSKNMEMADALWTWTEEQLQPYL